MEEDDEIPPLAVPISIQNQDDAPAPAPQVPLVNYILKAEHGKKIAVIVNEWGESLGLGVERALINEGEGEGMVEEWVELPNGCVCCSVKHSFVQALEQLVQQRHRFDYILLETTGLANPGPVASLLWVDDQLESFVHLNSIITIIDAKNLHFQLGKQRESSALLETFMHIAFVNVVVLNKVDLIIEEHGDIKKSEGLEDLQREIHNINSLAHVICSVRCQVELNDILDCKAYDAKINAWLGELLWEGKDMEVYRCKGVLSVLGSDDVHIIQAVRELYEIIPISLIMNSL